MPRAPTEFDELAAGPGSVEPIPPAAKLSPLAEGWAEVLGAWDWHWFVTVTWRPSRPSTCPERFSFATSIGTGPEQRAKAWRSMIWQSEREVLGRARARRPASRRRKVAHPDVAWHVRADEPHKSGAFHCHGLVRWPTHVEARFGALALEEPKRWAAMQRWAEDHGWARIEPPSRQEWVRGYCAKYATKGAAAGLIEIHGRQPSPIQRSLLEAGGGPLAPGNDPEPF